MYIHIVRISTLWIVINRILGIDSITHDNYWSRVCWDFAQLPSNMFILQRRHIRTKKLQTIVINSMYSTQQFASGFFVLCLFK